MQFPMIAAKSILSLTEGGQPLLKAVKLSEANLPDFRELLQAGLKPHAPDRVPDNAPQNVYAQIWANGEMVGEVYKGGSCMMTNAAAAKVKNLADGAGLGLAKERTLQIAEATGGEIRLMNEFAPKQNTKNQSATAPKPVLDPASFFLTRQAK